MDKYDLAPFRAYLIYLERLGGWSQTDLGEICIKISLVEQAFADNFGNELLLWITGSPGRVYTLSKKIRDSFEKRKCNN